MADDRVSDFASAAVHEVQDARWEPSLGKMSTMTCGRERRQADAGLKTTVSPDTSAGAIFQTGIATGKFHGVMTATGPTGCLTV